MSLTMKEQGPAFSQMPGVKTVEDLEKELLLKAKN